MAEEKKKKKKYPKLSKGQAIEIIKAMLEGVRFNSKDIVKDYKISQGSANKFLSLIKKPIVKISENDPLPESYLNPQSVKDVAASALYDCGFKTSD